MNSKIANSENIKLENPLILKILIQTNLLEGGNEESCGGVKI